LRFLAMNEPRQIPETDEEYGRRRRMVLAIQLVTLVVVLGVSVAAIPLADNLMRNQTEGYLALFVAAVLSGALFMLPGFGWAAIGAFAIAFESWWLPAIIGTTGQVIGEMYSYFLGYTGSRWIRRNRWYYRVQRFLRIHGFVTILVLAATPNPVFDIAGAVAGAARFGWQRFVVASWLGRLAKNLAISALAILGADIILDLIGA
jgi:membrane protein YqaA with SNARE-associated domain